MNLKIFVKYLKTEIKFGRFRDNKALVDGVLESDRVDDGNRHAGLTISLLYFILLYKSIDKSPTANAIMICKLVIICKINNFEATQ